MKLVFCNCPIQMSKTIAHTLVTRKLAACVNISGPITSVYVWEGRVCEEEECTLLIKCAEARTPALVAALSEVHPYDVPEILVVGVDPTMSYKPYLDWVRSECTSDQ